MRFRRIEKDGGGMANVGLKDQHIQGREDDVTTSESKTYIGSNAKKKVAMNKIKNTKVGDDIHYYINGQEGRGIVVKMANEYLEVFKEDGQLGTIHINDTFFVKDILINKQWDNMDDTERYDALTKIHAPSPRYITKQWNDIPEEIKVLLTKEGGNMAGGTGSTYEQGESKESETKDHARTGFAQNTQYSKKDSQYDKAGNRIETQAEKDAKILGRKSKKGRFKNPDQIYSAKEVKELNRKRRLEEEAKKYPKGPQAKQLELERKQEAEEAEKKELQSAARQIDAKAGKVTTPGHAQTKEDVKTSSSTSCPDCGKSHPGLVHEKKPEKKTDNDKKDKPSGGFVVDEDDYKDAANKALYKQWLQKKKPRPSPRTAHGSFGTTQSEAGQEAQSNLRSGISGAVESAGIDFGTATTKARPSPRTAHGGFGTTQSEEGQKVQANQRAATSSAASALGVDFGTATPSSKSDDFRKLKPVYEGDTKQARDTKKAWEVWLERQAKSHDNPSRNLGRGKRKREPELLETDKADDLMAQDAEHGKKVRENIKIRGEQKSDVEHGRYGSVGGTHNVAVSTDTKVDVTEGTGYEERPHISVEEAGKLPRSTFNESGSELTVSGSQDSKDEPKFSQPHGQEHPVRKAGLPQQHPNTYGVRYGMKGGVKKVWCPEHQLWEETTKDWHE